MHGKRGWDSHTHPFSCPRIPLTTRMQAEIFPCKHWPEMRSGECEAFHPRTSGPADSEIAQECWKEQCAQPGS